MTKLIAFQVVLGVVALVPVVTLITILYLLDLRKFLNGWKIRQVSWPFHRS